MPTFIFSDDYSQLEKKVYMKAARVACRLLKADHYDATIEVVRGSIGHLAKAAIACVSPKYYKLITHPDLMPHEVVHSLGHELIHFHQFERGDMSERPNKIIWKGETFPVAKVQLHGMQAYLDQPWEKEAFAKHDALFQAVTKEIPMADRTALDNECADKQGPVEIPDFIRDLIKAFGGNADARSRVIHVDFNF